MHDYVITTDALLRWVCFVVGVVAALNCSRASVLKFSFKEVTNS